VHSEPEKKLQCFQRQKEERSMMVAVSPDIEINETKLSTILDAIKNDAILIM
jgi:hypothetical protein